MWIIHKKTREASNVSYSGITWDKAKIRGFYKPVYENREEAYTLAKILSFYNPVGFEVSKTKEK